MNDNYLLVTVLVLDMQSTYIQTASAQWRLTWGFLVVQSVNIIKETHKVRGYLRIRWYDTQIQVQL